MLDFLSAFGTEVPFSVRPLQEADSQLILELYQGNPLYFYHCPPEPSLASIHEEFTDLPPGKGQADKFFLGLFENDKLVAVLDLILSYPNTQTAFIGFFMMAKPYQKKGLATQIITSLLECLSKDFTYVRLGVKKDYQEAENFWKRQGFRETGDISQQEIGAVLVMEKRIG